MPATRLFLIRTSMLTLIATFGTVLARATDIPPAPEQLEFFEKAVRPLLAEHCYSCHSSASTKLQAGLVMDSRDGLLRGGDSGEAIVPGDPDSSLMIEAIRYESYEMPPKGKLPTEDIEVLERWVEMGAPWPQEEAPSIRTAQAEFDLSQRKLDHWVWQPIESPMVPTITNTSWPREELDNFLLAKLEETKLQPVGDADRSALLRRLYFDLVGLPPTPQQAARFLQDASPLATEKLVDELLDSPHFGERWGRHWLDLVRYAESRGHEFDNDAPNAFQYRDYIIRALNADVPYDQLVREHIAGDLLIEPRLNPKDGYNESILATGFWFLGEWVHSPVDIRKDEADRFDNMIDVMSKLFLGVTVSCARCHDHKFDAISTADYYSLSGFLQSSDYRQVRFESLEHNRQIAKELAELDRRYRQLIHEALSSSHLELSIPERPLSEIAAQVVFDSGSLAKEDYLQDGFIFGNRPRLAGEPYLAWEAGDHGEDGTGGDKVMLKFATASAAVSDSFWNGLESVRANRVQNKDKLSELPRSGRTLRTPTFDLVHGHVACRVHGSGHVVACVDSHRLIAGPLHGETIVEIKPGTEWVELNLARYVGHRMHLEFTPAKDAALEVLLVIQGASPESKQELLDRESAIASEVNHFSEAAEQALGAESERLAGAWAEQRKQLQTRVMCRSQLAIAMMDGTGEDDHVLIRGNASQPGDIEPRHFLAAVSGNQPMAIGSGSGRLELAEQINDPANPLTSRVIVNRIWHYLMGRGIVPTTDDFGVLGQPPTHPELLDHLATQFARDGRSIKRLIRMIVLSRAYQMSSHASASAIATDPKNLLWHHRPPKRLEGEAIRDSLLLIAGRLDTKPFGEGVPIHLTAFMDGRGRPDTSGPLDGECRRSIYTAVRRNFLSPFMLTFDTPTPFSTMGRRNVSNVPAQALILMNDPLVVDLASGWAERAIDQQATIEARVEWMYQTAFVRKPTSREKSIASGFLTDQMEQRQVDRNDAQLWTDLAHALINTKEFIFLR